MFSIYIWSTVCIHNPKNILERPTKQNRRSFSEAFWGLSVCSNSLCSETNECENKFAAGILKFCLAVHCPCAHLSDSHGLFGCTSEGTMTWASWSISCLYHILGWFLLVKYQHCVLCQIPSMSDYIFFYHPGPLNKIQHLSTLMFLLVH